MVRIAKVGIREAKIHLSRYLKMVAEGTEVIITDRGRPVGKIIPVARGEMSLAQRLERLEERGVIEAVAKNRLQEIPPPIHLPEEKAQRYLQEDRESGP
ncbi:MAG: type II toxin-antitoxin system Phd/YefM family antitoxin [Syntrophobacteria bacterium]